MNLSLYLYFTSSDYLLLLIPPPSPPPHHGRPWPWCGGGRNQARHRTCRATDKDKVNRFIQEMVTKSGLVTDDPLLIRIPVYIQSEFIIEADRNLALLPQGENASWKL